MDNDNSPLESAHYPWRTIRVTADALLTARLSPLRVVHVANYWFCADCGCELYTQWDPDKRTFTATCCSVESCPQHKRSGRIPIIELDSI
jgi:hypothetical protein